MRFHIWSIVIRKVMNISGCDILRREIYFEISTLFDLKVDTKEVSLKHLSK